ncbi:oxidoreductase [Pyrenochaeta sp. MPI-SDFR-AT-0127]|nr:oxidoreductase [Pyrenochaeta sp. MPI-SDFR-AT-0127]
MVSQLALALLPFVSWTAFAAPVHPLQGRAYQHVASPANKTFDYVIVGGGLTGLTVAARLAENPAITVAVLEAGDFYTNVNGNASRVPGYGAQVAVPGTEWGMSTIPQAALNNRSPPCAQGKTIGGSTATNLITYHRSTKGAHERWASAVGDDGFKWDSFLPWMRKSTNFVPANAQIRAQNATVPSPSVESWANAKGPIGVTYPNWANPVASYAQEGWKSLGLNSLKDLTSGSLIGNQYSPMAIHAKDQSRATSESFIDLSIASGRQNLFIFTKSLAKKINFDTQKKAKSVYAESNGIFFQLEAKKEVVLAAGALHTPQLLMVSGIGPQETLSKHQIPVVKELSGVGKNWQDHPNFLVAFGANAITGAMLLDPTFAAAAAKEYNDKKTGILTHNLADYYAWEKVPDNQLSATAKSDLKNLPKDWPHYEVVLANVPIPFGTNSAQGIVMMQAVTSRGSVSISSTSTSDAPVLDSQTFASATDREIAVLAFKRARAFFSTPSMKKIITTELLPGSSVSSDEQILDWLRNNIGAGAHTCCTATMGKQSDANAVTDTKGRVLGVKGLRIVDASVLPFIPPGHIAGVLYGLAEKIADDMKRS